MDELYVNIQDEIIEQIIDTRETSGEVSYKGETLHYNWEYEIYIDKYDKDQTENEKCGKVRIEELTESRLREILYEMVMDGSRCGFW